MTLPKRMKFGIFLGPFHRAGENPTLAIDRDLELIEFLDFLGFDEAWIGEHHSAGWEIISSPEIFMGVAADRTKHIKLGTGVVSLPYHHPFMVANRMVQLDHMTHGRVMLGVGPGALPGDAYMLGIKSTTQRERMDEALGLIVRLLTETDPISYKSDWFELNEAILQLRPYQENGIPLAVASVQSPSGVQLAGKHGASVLTITVPRDPSKSPTDLKDLWNIAEESASLHGKTMNRKDWRLVIPIHLAEPKEQAIEDIRIGAGRYQREYFENTMGRDAIVDGPLEEIVDVMTENGAWIVGTPEDCIEGIMRLDERSGGFGGLMVQTVDWCPRQKLLQSYELLARHVMPHFQGSALSTQSSNQWAFERRDKLMSTRVQAIDKAKSDYANR